ncbi:MAG: ABC transporter ATP-binding protein [Methanobacteriaceae archaeon]|nr:ABC transporter ATP-binding protein [Methanobacteriaceae archaeon]
MVLSVKNLSFAYDSSKIIKEINFNIESGDFVSILGVNGSGKTTLIKCINKILNYSDGTVLVEDTDINKMQTRDIAKKIGYVPQSLEKGYMTVYDAVLLGRKPYIEWTLSQKDTEITENILKLLNLEKLSLRYLDELSGGELQKVVIARALVQEPKLLLLDEPTSGLDLKNQLDVMKIINKISKDKNISSLMIVHDLNLAIRYCDKFIMIKNGEIIVSGNMDELTSEDIKQTYGVDVIFGETNGISYIIPE